MGRLHRVYLGIGSNLGNREENCRRAVELLASSNIDILKESSLYETQPWGVKSQPSFINMAIEAETQLNPEELIIIVKDIEKAMGREKSFRWGPRLIDIDILLYDDIVINKTVKSPQHGLLNLKIPHPLMHQREFVLRPLAEIAPDIVHPLLKKKIGELLKALVSQEEGL